MAERLSEIKEQKQAQEEMEIHYSQMCEAPDTNTRKEHFAIMKKIYDKYASVRKIWDYIESARKYVNRFVKKISEIIQKVEKEVNQYFYVMRFYDIDNNWLFDKIGSTKDVEARQKQHLDYYPNHGFNTHSVEVLYSINTQDVPASTIEDYARIYLIKKYGEENYLSKDRFLTKIDMDDITKKIPTCLEKLRAAAII